MNKIFWISVGFAATVAASFNLQGIAAAQELPAAPAKKLSEIAPVPGLPRLTPTANGHSVHIMPTVTGAAALVKGSADLGPLHYHSGGSIMPSATLYAIYWIPASGKLQNGNPTIMSAAYQNLQTRFLTDYPGHGLVNILTQYYQLGFTPPWISTAGGLGGVAVDTSPYPASGCTDTATPFNCITDTQIQAEIQKVMTAKGWTGGLTKMFLLYTSKDEGSCFGAGTSGCAYTDYCAYHGFIPGSPNIIYANMPYGDLNVCAAGQPSPNGDKVADSVTSTASHEVTEAISDPLLNAWFTDPQGDEVGDLCAYNYGPTTWGTFNQGWNGHPYELQQEFDNHSFFLSGPGHGCVQVGPL
jgi:hypothetical protein